MPLSLLVVLAQAFSLTVSASASSGNTEKNKSKKSSQQSASAKAKERDKSKAADVAPEHEKRFFRALKNIESKNEEARVQMSIIESDGSTKSRELSIRRVTSGKEQRILARILTPADLKGMSLLSIVDKNTENQWIYFPSSKQTRKIVSAESSDVGILGSELQYNDFDPSVIRKSTAKLLKTEACGSESCDWIEAIPKSTGSPYSKVIVSIVKGIDLPQDLEYYIGDEKVKTVQFRDFKKISGVFRPHLISIKNLKNNRGTEIKVENSKINFGLNPDQVTLQQISRPF